MRSPEYQAGYEVAFEWAWANARLCDMDNLPDPWTEGSDVIGVGWDERQDAEFESGFRAGYWAAFELAAQVVFDSADERDREARRVAYDQADRVDLNGREA